jgi:predicted HicB family RNase H-like nuclease
MADDRIQTTVRLDPGLHQRVLDEAARQDRSVTSLITHYIRLGLAEDERRRSEGALP